MKTHTEKDLIGKKINILKETRSIKIGDILHTGDVYKIPENDPIADYIRENYEPVRILPPGVMKTQDYKAHRTNVYLDENGVITRITKG